MATLYVTNHADATISVIDIGTNLVTATVATDADPYNLAVTPDGSKLVVSTITGIQVFSLPGMTPLHSSSLGLNDVSIVATDTTAYACDAGLPGLVTVDLSTWAAGSITMSGADPTNVVLSRDGAKLYTDSDSTNQVWIIDVGSSTPSLLHDFTGTHTCQDGLAISADGTILYVGVDGGVVPVALPSGTPGTLIATAGGSDISDIQIGQSGGTLWAGDSSADTYQPVPTPGGPAGSVTTVTNPNILPQAGALSPDESTLYVTDQQASGHVQIINTGTGMVTGSISVGNVPVGALTVPPVTAPVVVGGNSIVSIV